jgi:hypothetical protein
MIFHVHLVTKSSNKVENKITNFFVIVNEKERDRKVEVKFCVLTFTEHVTSKN